MGVREVGFSLIFLLHLVHFVSSSPVQKTLPSEFMQKRKIQHRDVYGSKIEGGIGHGGEGGGKAPNNGENGGSKSPNTQGGAAVIPVYAAGAAKNNHHHNHHGAGNSDLKRLKFPTLLMIIGVYTLVQLCFFI